MTVYTVISTTSRIGIGHLTADPLAVIAGRVEVYGHGLYVTTVDATVDATDGDAAMDAVRGAVRIVGGIPTPEDLPEPYADRWTVIGVADNGVCPSWHTVAVVAGAHQVEGRYESQLSHRWVRIVDAATAKDAEEAGYQAASNDYHEAWN